MLKASVFCLFILPCLLGFSQKHQFIFLENKSNEWFTATVNGKKYESLGKNYIIIPQLENKICTLSITTQSIAETIFYIDIITKSKGFSIKKSNNNELQLFDINSFETVNSNILPASNLIENKIDNNNITITKTNRSQSIVQKIMHNEGINESIDTYLDGKDTIKIFIPFERDISEKLDGKKISEDNTNKNCKYFAGEFDVKAFINKLLECNSINDKFMNAGNLLKQKCYFINQIKRLSILFTSDANKFSFFKLALPKIADIQNFSSLASELKDANIINEFVEFAKQL